MLFTTVGRNPFSVAPDKKACINKHRRIPQGRQITQHHRRLKKMGKRPLRHAAERHGGNDLNNPRFPFFIDPEVDPTSR